MRIRHLKRDGDHLHYFLEDDEGNEIRQVDGEFPEVVAEARRRKKSVADVLAEQLGAAPEGESASVRVVVVNKEHHTHEEFQDFLRGLPEHSHPEYVDVVHTHDPDPAIAALTKRLDDEAASLAVTLEALQGLLDGHSHPLPIHSHKEIEAQLEAFQGSLDRLAKHEHPHEHPPHEHEETEARLRQLERQVEALTVELSAHGHPVSEHEHPDKPHSHHEYAEALAQHVADASRRTNARILSREEVGGKTRLILEETE